MPQKGKSPPTETSHKVGFEEVEHTADWALRIQGSDVQELLLNAAMGINSLMLAENDSCASQEEKSIELNAIDTESLLVEWLNELAYWAEAEMIVFQKFDIEDISPTHVKATLYGSRVTQLEKHIKAVTYHNLEIIHTPDGLAATVVFDV